MSEEKPTDVTRTNSIGLEEFIEQVKRELLFSRDDTTPLLSVDQVELQLQVTVHKEGNAGIQIQVVQFGGKLSNDDVHTVKVTLTPLISKEDRLRIYKEKYPEQMKALERVAIQGANKGSASDAKDY
jgi:hypothetical protein